MDSTKSLGITQILVFCSGFWSTLHDDISFNKNSTHHKQSLIIVKLVMFTVMPTVTFILYYYKNSLLKTNDFRLSFGSPAIILYSHMHATIWHNTTYGYSNIILKLQYGLLILCPEITSKKHAEIFVFVLTK